MVLATAMAAINWKLCCLCQSTKDEVLQTPRDTQEFKQIKAVFEACKAYIKVMNNGTN